jgi:hypothetical protein
MPGPGRAMSGSEAGVSDDPGARSNAEPQYVSTIS